MAQDLPIVAPFSASKQQALIDSVPPSTPITTLREHSTTLGSNEKSVIVAKVVQNRENIILGIVFDTYFRLASYPKRFPRVTQLRQRAPHPTLKGNGDNGGGVGCICCAIQAVVHGRSVGGCRCFECCVLQVKKRYRKSAAKLDLPPTAARGYETRNIRGANSERFTKQYQHERKRDTKTRIGQGGVEMRL